MSTPTSGITETDFHEYISEGAARLTPRALHGLIAELPALREEFPKIAGAGFAKAAHQVTLLAAVLEAFTRDGARELPYRAALEAAFALSYLHRDVDLIPDVLGKLGYIDDAAIIELVFARNAAALERFAQENGFDWQKLAPRAR